MNMSPTGRVEAVRRNAPDGGPELVHSSIIPAGPSPNSSVVDPPCACPSAVSSLACHRRCSPRRRPSSPQCRRSPRRPPSPRRRLSPRHTVAVAVVVVATAVARIYLFYLQYLSIYLYLP